MSYEVGEAGTPVSSSLGRLGSQKHLFAMPGDISYFNCANFGPPLRSVRQAGEEGLRKRDAPWLIEGSAWFDDVERLRDLAGKLFCVSSDCIAFVPSTSYGIGIAARNIAASPGDRVVVLADEYPSGFFTWQRFCKRTGASLARAERSDGQTWTEAVLAHIDERSRVVAVPNVHWKNGALLDIERIAEAAHDVDALLVIDASQSLGALPIDIATVRPDFMVAAGYKWLLGPLGYSYLYVDERHHDGEPLEENWINRAGSEDFTKLTDYVEIYRSGARRFDMGARSNFILVPMATAALDQLSRWGIANIAASLAEDTAQIRERAAGLGLDVPDADEHGPHMLGIRLSSESAGRVAEALAREGVITSVRGDGLRLSPHLNVSEEDIDHLIGCLAAASHG